MDYKAKRTWILINKYFCFVCWTSHPGLSYVAISALTLLSKIYTKCLEPGPRGVFWFSCSSLGDDKAFWFIPKLSRGVDNRKASVYEALHGVLRQIRNALLFQSFSTMGRLSEKSGSSFNYKVGSLIDPRLLMSACHSESWARHWTPSWHPPPPPPGRFTTTHCSSCWACPQFRGHISYLYLEVYYVCNKVLQNTTEKTHC